jgi:hypothetical protein
MSTSRLPHREQTRLRDGGLGTVPLSHLGRIGLNPVAACLASYDQPHARHRRVPGCHRRAELPLHGKRGGVAQLPISCRRTSIGNFGAIPKTKTSAPFFAPIHRTAARRNRSPRRARRQRDQRRKKGSGDRNDRALYGREAPRRAADTAQAVFESGGTGSELPQVVLSHDQLARGVPAFELFSRARPAASNGEARRLACSFFLLRPPGLPDRPFRKRVCNGGRRVPTL